MLNQYANNTVFFKEKIREARIFSFLHGCSLAEDILFKQCIYEL